MTKGYKTTEFWAMAATSIATLANQSGLLGSLVLPVEALAALAVMVASYIWSRTKVKASGDK